MSLGDSRMDDRSLTREVGEWRFFVHTFKYQHRERVGIGVRRWGDAVVLEELRG